MVQRKFTQILAAFWLLSGLASLPAPAQGRWDYLGNAHVDGARDHDNIPVTRSRGMFRAIQIRVKNNAVEFQRVIIHYGNGSSEPIEIRSVIPAGGMTRVIDLPGERRVIHSVEFWYSRANFRARRPE